MGSIRILLLNAINPYVEWETRYPPLGLGYLAASVRKSLQKEIITLRVAHRNVRAIGRTFQPHLVGISAVSHNLDIAKRYAAHFTSQRIPAILGGVHVSALPRCLPRECALGCLGESEETFVEVVKAFLGNRFLPLELSRIRGIAFCDGDKLCCTPNRPPISKLDVLPMPARNLLDICHHTYMFTSRGCPFRCTFCTSSRYWNRLRLFSAAYVADEIEFLMRKYGVNMISFFDDLFKAKLSRLEEILRLLERRHLLRKVRFTCNCRADTVTPESAHLLARLGFVSVGLGLESGDDEVLQFLKGGQASVRHNMKAVNLLKNVGIAVNASFIIGSPQETREQVLRTYHFIRHSRLDLFDAHLLTPYPGTPHHGDVRCLEGRVDQALQELQQHPETAVSLAYITSQDSRKSTQESRNEAIRSCKHPIT